MPAYVHPTYTLIGQIPTLTAAYEETCVEGLHLTLRPSIVCGGDLCKGRSGPLPGISNFSAKMYYPDFSAQSPGSLLILPATYFILLHTL